MRFDYICNSMNEENTEIPKKRPVGRPRKPAEKRPVGRPKGSRTRDPRGGKREGAGRKVYLAPEEKKVNITLTISPRVRELCDLLRDKGLNLSEIFCKRIEQLSKTYTGED